MNKFGKVALIKEAWKLFKKHFNLILGLIGIYLAYYIAQWFVNFLFRDSVFGSLLSFAFMIAFLVIQLGAYNMMLRIVDGKKAHLKDLYTYKDPAMKIIRNIVAGIIVGFLVVVGLILFVIPGIYIAIRLMFFTYYIVDKDAGIIESLQKSWHLTRKGVINLFLLMIVFMIINFIGAIFVIGMAFTLPLTFLATALLYRKFQK